MVGYIIRGKFGVLAHCEDGHMTDKELKKLSRADLLEMLLAQTKENEQLKEQITQLQKQLHERQIMIDQSGSIAEAALKLNGIFEAAQNAADQYLENIRRLGRTQE